MKERHGKEAELQEIGRSALACIVEMVRDWESTDEDNGDKDSKLDIIREDPLSVQVREGWHNAGEKGEIEEFEILLSTGGPATRIIGELNEYNEPIKATLQAQDWFMPWTNLLDVSPEEQEALLNYCGCFYFGEG